MGKIRLGCMNCDIAHEDIDEEEVDELIGDGWREINEVQSYEDSLVIFENPSDAPPGYSVLDWQTHIGYCPGCATQSL